MGRHEIVRIDLLEGCDDLPEVIIRQRRNEMEAADHCVNLLYARCGLSLLDSIDDATMAAGRKNHQSLASQQEIGPDLMLEVVRDERSSVFRCRYFVREAAEAIHDADFLCRIAKGPFESALSDLTSRERVIGDDRRFLRHHE